MKKSLFLCFAFLLSAVAEAQTLNNEFKSAISEHKVGQVQDQSYCYLKNGSVAGYQVDKLQRIASLSKLFSTLLVSETMNLKQTFATKIYIGKNSLHIEGGRDPYFDKEKILLLFKALNNLGFKSFNTISYSHSFIFHNVNLAFYLNPKNKKVVKSNWNAVRKFAAEEGVDLDEEAPSLSAKSVLIADVNPLQHENPAVYIHRSKPFYKILKSMNVQSKNDVAENVYLAGNAIKPISKLLVEKGIDDKTFKIYNGSGLPIERGSSRVDNLATCKTVLKVITLLSNSIKKHELVLSDVIAVSGGKDLGSFRDRFITYPELSDLVISKTGTLKQTSSIAGILMSGSGIPFAILNHTNKAPAARKFQDGFILSMFHEFGEEAPVTYQKISIFPWDKSDFLRPAR
jgi:D-alanyl-D-alanine carboxypeptidase